MSEIVKKFLPDNFSQKNWMLVVVMVLLGALVNMFDAHQGIGIEPSEKGINLIDKINTNQKLIC